MSSETTDARDVTPGDLVGTSVQRSEDPHLLTGDAEYTDDIQHPRGTHLSLLRSQYGHAGVAGIDTSAAEAMDGVVAVYTFEDVRESGVPGLIPPDAPSGSEFSSVVAPDRPLLADGKVVYQGQPVAAVVAEDRYTAAEAADLIEVEYDRLDAVVDPREALDDGAPAVHDDAPDNVAFVYEKGDREAADAGLAEADRVIEAEIANNRVIPTAMEPRAAVARYRGSTGDLAVEMSTQNPHKVQSYISDSLGVPDHHIRVRPPDVGGGFGAKLQPYAGYLLAAWCAMQVERPVKWTATRSEDCASMVHSRQQVTRVEAGVDDDGRIRGMRLETTGNLGGFMTFSGPGIFTSNFGRMFVGQYDVPGAHIEVTGAFTNTAPLAAYRGAGRPEATYFVERFVEIVARELGMDPAEVRRRNFIDPDEFPHETSIGHTYDSGDYEMNLDAALDLVGYDELRERQREAREEGRYLGVGLSCYVEACGASPGWPETGVVRIKPSGKVVVLSGTTEIGGGHHTSYAQIVSDRLGVPFEDIDVVEGDTAQVPEGGGTGGSRAMAVGGSALFRSAEKVIEKAREIAAHQLEAAPEDVEFEDGTFSIRGAPGRSMTIQEVADVAYGGADDRPEGMEPGLDATSYFDPAGYTYPFGTHVAVVEVDPGTGEVEFERYLAVDDVGEQINPKLVEGQIHGGVVQGLGQALYEEAVYDSNGNLLTASLQDYAVPKAEHVPEIEWDSTVTPSPHNPMGAKGVGEAGTIAAPPAVVNAVVDALAPLGVENIDMPLTDEAVWQAVNGAE